MIIIDEAHRTGAASYQNIMQYFTPRFWLGMTASPERTDAFDVYDALIIILPMKSVFSRRSKKISLPVPLFWHYGFAD